jgi:putative cell wall-binding protein
VSTATTRLRRAGAGGLAAAVVAGTLVASAGLASAAATPVAGTYQLTATSAATTIYPGLANQAAGDVEYWTTSGWTTGDTLTFTVGANNCSTAAGLANAVSFSAAPSVTLAGPFVQTTGAAGTAAKPTFTTKLGQSSAACTTAGVNDTFTITLTSPASPVDPLQVFSFTLGGIKYTTGATALGDVSLGAAVTGALSTPAPAAVVNATVANTKFTAASVVPAVPSQTGVALGNMTASDVGASHITSPITFTASAGVFTATSTPTLTGPAGTTWDVTGMGGATLTATLKLTSPAIPTTTANTFVLSGAQLDAPATAQAVKVTAAYAGPTTIGAAATVASVVAQTRVGGSDRYATAAALFATTTNSAVLASGANFPDALSANFLAKAKGAGILLTDPKVLPSVTLNKILSTPVATVYIVGGTGAVSQAIENQLAATHIANNPTFAFISVIRIAGADRYATNLAVNEYQFATHATAIVATGANFADALSVGPAVVHASYPLVLTATASLSSAAQQQLVDMGVKNVVIVGGTGAVSTAVENAIKSLGITITARLAGADRTQTAAAIATWETTPVLNGGLGFSQATVHISNGANFPDALAAGPVAGSGTGAVILLSLSPTTLGTGAPTYLGGLVGTVKTLNALGLTGAVSPAVMNAAAVALAG